MMKLRLTRILAWAGMGAMLALAVVLTACAGAPPSPPMTSVHRAFDPNYADWNYLLSHYVTPDGVDYAGLVKERGRLDIVLAQLVDVSSEQFENWTRETQLSFLINAHNAHAIDQVLAHYPIRSLGQTRHILPARGLRNIRLLGREWSLAQLAGEIMSYPYQESRAIFLLNWAARGCAPLPPVALTGLNLEELLNRQTRLVLADPRYVSMNARKNIIYVPRFIKWYRSEIERDYGTLWTFLGKFLPAEQAKAIAQHPPRIRWTRFDHALNDNHGAPASPASAAAQAAILPPPNAAPAKSEANPLQSKEKKSKSKKSKSDSGKAKKNKLFM